MEYLEDYLSEDMIDALESELRKVYDNEEFVMCAVSALNSNEEADQLLNFLRSNTIAPDERYKVTLFQMKLEKKR